MAKERGRQGGKMRAYVDEFGRSDESFCCVAQLDCAKSKKPSAAGEAAGTWVRHLDKLHPPAAPPKPAHNLSNVHVAGLSLKRGLQAEIVDPFLRAPHSRNDLDQGTIFVQEQAGLVAGIMVESYFSEKAAGSHDSLRRIGNRTLQGVRDCIGREVGNQPPSALAE
jgi:hypothetical protein